MGRFEWLEFDYNKDTHADVKESESLKLNAEQFINKAKKAFEMGDYEYAIRYYSKALNLNNYILEAWKGQLLALLCLGQYNDVITWSDHAMQFIDDPFFTAAKAFALNRMGAHNEALQMTDITLSSTKADWFCWLVRGDVLLSLGNVANAEFCFLKSIEYVPDDWFVYMLIGICYLSAKRYHNAIEYLYKALKNKKENPLICFHLANAYDKVNNVNSAITYIQLAIKLKPNFDEAHKMLKRLKRKEFIFKLFNFIRSNRKV